MYSYRIQPVILTWMLNVSNWRADFNYNVQCVLNNNICTKETYWQMKLFVDSKCCLQFKQKRSIHWLLLFFCFVHFFILFFSIFDSVQKPLTTHHFSLYIRIFRIGLIIIFHIMEFGIACAWHIRFNFLFIRFTLIKSKIGQINDLLLLWFLSFYNFPFHFSFIFPKLQLSSSVICIMHN